MGLLDVERVYLVPCSDCKRSNLLSDESYTFVARRSSYSHRFAGILTASLKDAACQADGDYPGQSTTTRSLIVPSV
jgi:hypothetical protein